MVQPTLSILLIDDHPASRSFLGGRLTAFGAAVHLAGSVAEGVAALRGQSFDLVLSKLSSPGQGGMMVAQSTRRSASRATIVDLQPEPGSTAPFDLALADPGEIHFFFTALRYLAGPSPGGEPDHLAGAPS